MPLTARIVSTVTALPALAALVGLFLRKRADASLAFTAYLCTACLGHGLVAAFPRTFWTWEFWLLTDAVQAALYVAIAFEIGFKTFRPLPRGYMKIRRIFFVLTLGIVAAVAFYPSEARNAFDLTLIVARVFYGAALLFSAFFALTEYHNVPVDPVQQDIALGLGVFGILTAFTEALSKLDPILGWGRDFVVKWSYPVLLAWWVRRAWAEEPPTALSRETMEMLQPWRVKRIRWD